MDLTVNKNYKNVQVFGAKLDYRTRRTIKNGIRSQYKYLSSSFSKKIADLNLLENKKMYQKILSEIKKFGDGTFSFYNGLGLSPKVTRIDFANKNGGYRGFNLPTGIQNEIILKDVSNIFVAPRYKIKEFPANRLGWLYDFFKNIKL